MNAVKEQIRDFIADKFLSGGDKSKLTDETSLERAHIVDSAGVMDIILYLEETFGFTVETDDAVPENFDTVANIAAYVERKQKSG